MISSRASAIVHSTKNQNTNGTSRTPPWAMEAKAALPTAKKLPAHLAMRLSLSMPARRR